MSLSTEDTARLLKLKAARDQLLTGRMVQEIEFDGVRHRYFQPTEANTRRLEVEIQKLEAQATSRPVRIRGALRFHL